MVWLNDYAYDPAWLPWAKLKTFLEGEHLKVAVPKTCGGNYTFEGDAPVLGTAPDRVHHPTQQHETQQMHPRIRYFEFHHYFNPGTCPKYRACQRCCADWFLAGVQ